MTSTLTRIEANQAMRPLKWTVSLSDTAESALSIMRSENRSFLPVVASETGKLLGVVLKKGLENGCARMGHDLSECELQNHLKSDAPFCFEDEILEGPHEHSEEPFVIVVDHDRVPVGVIELEQ